MSLPAIQVKPEAIDWLDLPRRYMNPGEVETLVALANSVKAETVLEIGCNAGRTSALLLHNVPTLKKLVGIDVPPGYAFAKHIQRNEVPQVPGIFALHDPRFELKVRPRGAFEFEPHELPDADLIFIDGDHGREAVERDSWLAAELVRPGGMIVWHDYHDRGTVDVKPVLDELREAGRDIRHVQGTWFAVERVE